MLSRVRLLNMLLKMMTKILNSKLVIMWEYQNINTFSQRAALQIGLKKSL